VRAAGRSVALVDHRPFGGTCALLGSDPKKMLISGAEAIDAHAEAGTDRILGAHLVGPDADEVINLFAIEIRHGLTAKDIEAAMLARWRPPTSTIWSDSRGPRSRKFAGLCLQVIPPRSGSALGIDVINLGRTSTERCSG